MIWKGIILGSLFAGFLLLFWRIRQLRLIHHLMKQTRESMNEAARKRLLQNRRTLLSMQNEHTLWLHAEQILNYSGLKRRFSFLTAENWIVGNIVVMAAAFLILLLITPKWWMAICGILLLAGTEGVMIAAGRTKSIRSVERNLLKFLDFLGNYSITAGEVTGIFNQISRYVEEPLKSALDECFYEAQTTGDAGLALLSMAEKIEHPRFKELVRNMEISIRYCADFTVLVNSSRRTMREHLRMGGERKSMLREAAVNMMLLLALSGFILLTVDKLIELSIWHVLLFTLPGRIALGVLLLIFLLFAAQLYRIDR